MNGVYREIIKLQETQINQQQERISELEKMSEVIDAELERVHEIERVIISNLDESLASRTTDWIMRLWKRCFPSRRD